MKTKKTKLIVKIQPITPRKAYGKKIFKKK